MEDSSKFWLAGAGVLIGAITGAALWAQRAASLAAAAAAQKGGDDVLIETARTAGTSSLAAAIQGGIAGAIVGLILAVAYVYFSDPDRRYGGREIKADDNY
jgi:chloramphenicol 3-O-phosphotransferase